MGFDSSDWISEIALTRPKAGWGIGTVSKAADGRPVLRIAKSMPKVACDPKAMTVTSVIVSGEEDATGDVIVSEGVNTRLHKSHPVVLYWHGEAEHKYPIAKSRKANGDYGVELVGDRLLATTQFSSKDKVSSQLFRLVEDDMLSGWSVAGDPVEGTFRPLSSKVSKSLGRRPMQFDELVMWEYSLTPFPVDPQAMTIIVEKGRVGSEQMDPYLKKSFAPYILKPGRSVQVTKAMPYDTDPAAAGTDTLADPAPIADEPMGDEPMGDESAMKPTPKAFYDFAQGCLDIVDQCRNTIAMGEHMDGKGEFEKMAQEAADLAERAKEMADKISGELSDDAPDDTEPADGETDTADDASDGLNTDDEGGIVTKSRYKPIRWTTADVARARVKKASESPPEKIKRTRIDRELDRELRLFNENKKLLAGVA